MPLDEPRMLLKGLGKSMKRPSVIGETLNNTTSKRSIERYLNDLKYLWDLKGH